MANPHPTPRVVRQQRLEPLQGLDIQVMGQLIADQPAGDLVAGEVVAGQADAHPGTLVARSTFPELYPVLAPERPPDGNAGPNGRGRASWRPPWDPGGQVDVSDALSGACTGKAPGWQAGPNGRGRAS